MKPIHCIRWLARLLALFCIAAIAPLHAASPVPSAEQLQQFQNLPPAQRQAVLRALQGGSAPAPAASQPSTTPAPAPVSPPATAAEVAIPRIKNGDTILLHYNRKEAVSGELPKAVSSQIPDPKIYTLDKSGVLDLPNAGRIPLAGLTEEEAGLRLSVVPALRGLAASVKILPVEQELKSFGYDLFTATPDAFALTADIPVPDDYVVGPGDMVLVQLYGKDNSQYELPVTREGTLQFPGIGPIRVGGQPFAKVRDLLMRRVQGQFIGLKASVQLGRLRSIQIFVLGDVERPGSYTVSGLTTLTNAVFASGGIKKIGSMRQIQLKRQGKLVVTMDFYDLLLKGDNSADARLQPGDVIFVPPVGKTAGISGEVRRPAVYELKTETTLEELIVLAGGLSAEAFPHIVQIERIYENRERTVIDVDMAKPEGRQAPLVSGDIVRVHPVLDKAERIVALSGYVPRPGNYQWTEGMRLTQLIPSLRDLPSEVDGRYLLVKRENPKERTIELLNADLVAALEAPESGANILLQPRDIVYVFSIHEDRRTVIDPLLEQIKAQSGHNRQERETLINGVVHHPGRYPLSPGMRVSDLLKAAGGLTDKAYTLKAELTRFTAENGEPRKQELLAVDLAGVLRNEADKDLVLAPYDQLVIQRVPNWNEEGFVTIAGEVTFPGKYSVRRGEKLSEVFKRAGGLTQNAFPKGSLFLRESVRSREQEHLDRFVRQLEQDLALTAAQGATLGTDKESAIAQGHALLKQARATKALGRVAIDLEKLLDQDEGYDVTVQDGDRLYITQRPDEVTVVGEVYYPTSHLFSNHYDRGDYVGLSGGATERGNKGAIYVVHANGSVSPPAGWFSWEPRMGPGDTVVVPIKVDRISALKLVGDVSQILYQLAVSAAALKVLNVF